MRTLIGPEVLTADKELSFLAQVNKEKFAAVQVGDRSVLLTPHGELPNGLFLDPSEVCALSVDHKALTASKADEPLSAAQATSMREASAMRTAVDAAMVRYVGDVLPNGVVTTYGSVGAGTRIVCCVASLTHDLPNYWAGRWTAEWTLEVPSGGSVGQLTGKVQAMPTEEGESACACVRPAAAPPRRPPQVRAA